MYVGVRSGLRFPGMSIVKIVILGTGHPRVILYHFNTFECQ